MRRIPVIICIDVEPDEREIDGAIAKDWEGFEGTVKFFSDLRPRLEEATGAPVSFSWFFRMDPQVEHTYGLSWWVVKRYGEVIKQLELAGDELGLHTHAWRWDGALHKWIIDHGDQKWVNHCLHTSFEAYRSAFGRPCLSFRFGDRWMNNETMGFLESLGVKFDLTVEPGRKAMPVLQELHTGSLPDYMVTPRWPYRPSRKDFRKHSRMQGRGLWAIPLSTGRYVEGRPARLKRAAMALGIDLQRGCETEQLNLSMDGPLFHAIMNNLLTVWRKRYLAPVVRTDAGIRSTPRANMEQNVKFLLSHPLVNRFKCVRPAEAIELIR